MEKSRCSSPAEQISSWFQLSQPTTLETSCGHDDGVRDQVQVGLGELLQDISVATEVTHWLDQDVSLETEVVWGAYILGSPEQIWTFGVAYQPDEWTVVLRTVYSFTLLNGQKMSSDIFRPTLFVQIK